MYAFEVVVFIITVFCFMKADESTFLNIDQEGCGFDFYELIATTFLPLCTGNLLVCL